MAAKQIAKEATMSDDIKVLFVEDDIVDVELVKRTLQQKSDNLYEILHVPSLQQALALDGGDFDVVLLDLSLPDSEGLDTVSRVVSEFPEAPVIVVTGNADPKVGSHVVELGAEDYCTKGEVDRFPLVRTIQHAILRKKAKRLETQVQKSQRLESLGMLASGIAHDFTNMLLIILSNADLALMHSDSNSGTKNHLNSIKTAALRLTELTEQMLAYAGKGSIASERVDISSLVNEMGHLLRVSVSRKIAIKYSLQNDLPAVKADPSQIRQIVLNLITNASDAIGDQTGEITLATGTFTRENNSAAHGDVETTIKESFIFIDVKDTGSGISAENTQKIFEAFYTTKKDGHGLGLAAVVGIVNGHGGDIEVISAANEGTTIRVLLPCFAEAAEVG